LKENHYLADENIEVTPFKGKTSIKKGNSWVMFCDVKKP
jgi:hypothetical protein